MPMKFLGSLGFGDFGLTAVSSDWWEGQAFCISLSLPRGHGSTLPFLKNGATP